jgi:hypothetical protein
MRETFPFKLLQQFLHGTPEQLADITHYFEGQAFPECQPSPAPQRSDPHRYALRRGRVCWVLDFKPGSTQLKSEIDLGYVACLFSQPDEPLPSATLFSKSSGGHRKDLANEELPDRETGLLQPVTVGVGIAQLPPDKDEAKARSAYSAMLREYKETADDLAIPESERLEAQRSYDELLAFLREHYRPAPSPGQAVTKLVHKSIRRLCEHLLQPIPGEKTPDPTAIAFAAYIAEHILLPSRRYTRAKPGARVRIARGELAGRLIFECPPGDRWSVHF